MRTELTADLAGCQVRGVITIGTFEEMLGGLSWQSFTEALEAGDPRIVHAVLRASLKAAGDLRPLEIVRESARLLEEAGVQECHTFAVRLINDALSKAETARKNSLTAPVKASKPAAGGT
jgi:hypothetical protein